MVPAGAAAVPVALGVAGLESQTTYHVRLVAVNATDTTYGSDATFTTDAGLVDPVATSAPAVPSARDRATPGPSAPEPAAPVIGRAVAAGATSGHVRVRLRGTDAFVDLDGSVSVPVGSQLDASAGSVTLVTALPGGRTQTGTFRGGRFEVRQDARAGGMVDVCLRGPRPGPCSARVLTSARKRRRSLWGQDQHGRFRTHGADSVATVRGTRWYTEDRCDGTLTRVTEGSVVVRDRHRERTKLVTAGHRYLARR